MSGQWKPTTTKFDASMGPTAGQPWLSQASPNKVYLGRVVIEVYEVANNRPPADGLAYSAEPGASSPMNQKQLLQRVADTFATRFSGDKGFMSEA